MAARPNPTNRIFPDSLHRVAVFTFDDPDKTDLGNAISFLLSKKLLFFASVSSVGVINYSDSADPAVPLIGTLHPSPDKIAYFDKVDAITRDQAFELAIWGRVTRAGENSVRIDAFLQIPADANQDIYRRRVQLPQAMGGGSLIARLTSDRIPIQSIQLRASMADEVRTAAREVAKLRSAPRLSADVIGNIDGSYTIVSGGEGWVELSFSDGRRGWTSVDEFCRGGCGRLSSIADFASYIMALTSGSTPRPYPEGLTEEAAIMREQLTAITALPEKPDEAIKIAERWIGNKRKPSPPFENVLAVAKLGAELNRERSRVRRFDEIRLSKSFVEQLIDPLVEASIADPSDRTVLNNLVPLFDYVGDVQRRDLARKLTAHP